MNVLIISENVKKIMWTNNEHDCINYGNKWLCNTGSHYYSTMTKCKNIHQCENVKNTFLKKRWRLTICENLQVKYVSLNTLLQFYVIIYVFMHHCMCICRDVPVYIIHEYYKMYVFASCLFTIWLCGSNYTYVNNECDCTHIIATLMWKFLLMWIVRHIH